MRFVVLYNANGQRVGVSARASANGRSQLSCWCGCASDSGSMLVHYGCPDVLTCVVKCRRLVLMSEAPDIGMGSLLHMVEGDTHRSCCQYQSDGYPQYHRRCWHSCRQLKYSRRWRGRLSIAVL
ncbi:hypothetical protein IG631_17539 [Alternaria alternata]|nr:hypothetical protein IG631_17539 [Alternaria alternata]